MATEKHTNSHGGNTHEQHMRQAQERKLSRKGHTQTLRDPPPFFFFLGQKRRGVWVGTRYRIGRKLPAQGLGMALFETRAHARAFPQPPPPPRNPDKRSKTHHEQLGLSLFPGFIACDLASASQAKRVHMRERFPPPPSRNPKPEEARHNQCNSACRCFLDL